MPLCFSAAQCSSSTSGSLRRHIVQKCVYRGFHRLPTYKGIRLKKKTPQPPPSHGRNIILKMAAAFGFL